MFVIFNGFVLWNHFGVSFGSVLFRGCDRFIFVGVDECKKIILDRIKYVISTKKGNNDE